MPPSRTRLAAALVESPTGLVTPPLNSAATLRMPPVIVVAPVYVLAVLLSVSVPAPVLVMLRGAGVVLVPSLIVPANVVELPLAPMT